jgi:hypothetical protein
MDEVKRTPLIVLLAGLVGCMFGSITLGYAALFFGGSFLRFAPGGIHSDWTPVWLFGTLVCIVLGGIAGGKGAIRLIKSWRV